MKSSSEENKKKRSSDSGITLIELLIVLALMGVVMTLGFSFFFFGNKTFKLSEEKAENQFDVRMPAEFVAKEVRYADTVQLLTTPPTPTAGTFDIYVDAEQLKYNKGTTVSAIPGAAGVGDYTFSVSRVLNKNILSYTIGKSGTDKYDVTTQVVVLNAGATDITGTGAIGLRFTLNKVITGAPTTIVAIINENMNDTANQYSVYSMPSTIGVRMSDGTTDTAVVSWSNTISTLTIGSKTSQGTVTGYSAKKVNLTVTVNGVTITGLVDPAAVNVDHNSSYDPPSTVIAHIQGGPDQNVPVSWTPEVNADTVGTHSYSASVSSFTAHLTVNVIATVSSLESKVDSVVRSAVYTMPSVIATMSDGSPQDLGNIWSPNSIDTSTLGVKTCTASYVGKTATLNVTVTPNDGDIIQTALNSITSLNVTNPTNRNNETKPAIDLPSTVNGVTFTFTSMSASISASGVVTRSAANQTGSITLVGSKGSTSISKTFSVDIPKDKNNGSCGKVTAP